MDVDHQRFPRSMKSQKSKNNKGKRKNNGDSLKVVYISSPMKVKTSASRFRSLVQQLTGKNSDVSEYMEANMDFHAVRDFHEIDCDDPSIEKGSNDQYDQRVSSISQDDTPTSSDSFLGPIDSVFTSEIDEQFAGMFSSNSIFSHIDVLGSYDELL